MKYASGVIFGWRGLEIARMPQEGGRWYLGSPISNTLYGPRDGIVISEMVPGERAICRVIEQAQWMVDHAKEIAEILDEIQVDAEILKSYKISTRNLNELIYAHNDVPDSYCSCGYYTYKDFDAFLSEYKIERFPALAIMRCWGKIQRYTLGYRSEYTEPAKVFISPYALSPYSMVNKMSIPRRATNIRDEMFGDLQDRYPNTEFIMADVPFQPSVLDTYLDAAEYPPIVEMPEAEIILEDEDGQDR